MKKQFKEKRIKEMPSESKLYKDDMTKLYGGNSRQEEVQTTGPSGFEVMPD